MQKKYLEKEKDPLIELRKRIDPQEVEEAMNSK